jgi:hypothetical protein
MKMTTEGLATLKRNRDLPAELLAITRYEKT